MYDNAMATKKGRVLLCLFISQISKSPQQLKQCIAFTVFKFLNFKIHAHNPC